jgi:hypothetical protein
VLNGAFPSFRSLCSFSTPSWPGIELHMVCINMHCPGHESTLLGHEIVLDVKSRYDLLGNDNISQYTQTK